MNFQSIPLAKQTEDIDPVCCSLKKSSFSSASSLFAPTKFLALSLQMVRGLPLRLMNLLSAAMKKSVVHFQMSSFRGKADKDGDIALVGCLISGLCLMIEWATIVPSCGMKSWIGLRSICWQATHDVFPSNRLHSETSNAFVDSAGDELATFNRPVTLP